MWPGTPSTVFPARRTPLRSGSVARAGILGILRFACRRRTKKALLLLSDVDWEGFWNQNFGSGIGFYLREIVVVFKVF